MTKDLHWSIAIASLGLACGLPLLGCDAVVGDPQSSASAGGTDGSTSSEPASTDSDGAGSASGETTEATTAAQGDTAATTTSTDTDPETSGSGSTGPEPSDTGSSTGSTPYPACLEPLRAPYHDMLGPACDGFVIIEYDFQAQPVFVFDSSQCGFFDQFFPVYTDNCELLCNLYGLAGNTVCEGVEFFDNAVEGESWPYPE